ncbi:MAG: DUF3224 domain-containing protein [Burkholderiales bacterium]|nr:DUF3224 domain-containing protein [Burkholderiales bacterium]
MQARGTFIVTLLPLEQNALLQGTPLGRMSIDKQFDGDMIGSSKGEMMAIRSPVEGSAGYVAMECVTATLHGRAGSFALQHNGVMTRGAPQLTVTVVPDTGTEQLAGIKGILRIIIEGGKHFYEFDYELPS